MLLLKQLINKPACDLLIASSFTMELGHIISLWSGHDHQGCGVLLLEDSVSGVIKFRTPDSSPKKLNSES